MNLKWLVINDIICNVLSVTCHSELLPLIDVIESTVYIRY